MIKLQITLVAVLCSFACCAVLPALAAKDPLDDDFSPIRSQVLEVYHQAGVSGDRSRIPEMIHILQTHNSGDVQMTLLLALARLGANDALPAFDAVIQNKRAPTPVMLSNFAQAARARLLAETEPTPHAQAERFFKELGETPDQLSEAIRAYNESMTGSKPIAYPLRDIDAEDELADLIYHGHAQELLADPLIAQVDFNRWDSTRVKIEMARLTPDQQRQALIDRLAHTKLWYDDQWDEAQLLLDLGHAQAAQLAVAKLQEMDSDSKSYAPEGFRSLFNVLYTAEGSTHQSPAWDHFRSHSDPKIKNAANRVFSGFDTSGKGIMVYGY